MQVLLVIFSPRIFNSNIIKFSTSSIKMSFDNKTLSIDARSIITGNRLVILEQVVKNGPVSLYHFGL